MSKDVESWNERCIRIEKETVEKASKASKFEKDMALAFGCIDFDRCNGRIIPQGSCNECIIRSMEVVKQLKKQGYKIG